MKFNIREFFERGMRKSITHLQIIVAVLILVCSTCLTHAVGNIADLRAINPGSVAYGDLVMMPGYYSPGDRGGGLFIWTNSTSSDDGGAFIIPNTNPSSGRWMRVLNGETPNVKMWGARGNGSQNDTVSLQNALDARTKLPIGEMLFPAGTYLVTNTLVFSPIVHIRGEGNGNNTVVSMQGNYDVFQSTTAMRALAGISYADWDHGVIFENMEIDCDPSSTTAAALVLFQPGEASAIRNVITGDGGYGVRVFGVGAPGLRLEHVSCFLTHVANVSIEGKMPNGTTVSQGGSVVLVGVSGDGGFTTNCFIRLEKCYPTLSIYDFKGEGSYGGGFISYNFENGDTNSIFPIGAINVYGGTYNCGGSDCDFVVLKSRAKVNAPVYISNVNLYNVRYLIRDDLTGRTVYPDIGGLLQATSRLPIQYDSFIAGQPWTRLTVGDTARYNLYPPTTGWYRVIQNRVYHMGGTLTISSYVESSQLQFDDQPGMEWDDSGGTIVYEAQIDVTRKSVRRLNGWHPHVTKARAGSYYNPSAGGSIGFVDIYVEELPSSGEPIVLAHPLDGMDYGNMIAQLLTPTNALTNFLPTTNCVLNYCTTNSLIRSVSY